MEKVVTKRSIRDFRQRENPWKDGGPLERLAAMLLICQTHATREKLNKDFRMFIGLFESEAVHP